MSAKKKMWPEFANTTGPSSVYFDEMRVSDRPKHCTGLVVNTRMPVLLVQLLRDKIVRFLIKASNLAGLLTSIRQIFPDMEPCQISLPEP